MPSRAGLASAHALEGSAASEQPSEGGIDLSSQVAAINGMSEPSNLATHVRDPTRGSTSSAAPSAGANSRSSHSKADLPIRGQEKDAFEAVQKLERIRKLKESKQRLRRGTGVEVLRPKFWEEIKRKRAKKGAEDDESSSDESLDLSRTLGEVKMAIASLPHFPVMAVKGAASRAIHLVGRGDTTLPDREGSPAPSQSDGDPSEAGTQPRRKGLRFGSGRLGSRGGPGPSPIPEAKGSMEPTANGDGPVRPQALRGGFELGLAPSATSRTGAADSDLDAVREERRDAAGEPVIEEAREEEHREDVTRTGAVQRDQGLARPRLTLQGPSEDGLAAAKGPIEMSRTSSSRSAPSGEDMSRNASQTSGNELLTSRPASRAPDMALSSSSTSILNGDIHDEPLTQDDGAVADALVHGSSTDGEDSSDESGSDIDEDLAQRAASLCLEHVGDMSKKDMRRAVREARRQARKQSTAGGRPIKKTTAIQDRVSRGLHYASSTSRQRRAYEKYSPNPATKLDTAAALRPATGSLSRMSPNASTGALDMPASGPASPRESCEQVGSPVAGSPDLVGMSTPFRTLTAASVASSGKGSASGTSFRSRYLHTPRIFSLRRRHGRHGDEHDDETGPMSPRTEDPEMELERVLRKLAAEQAPDEVMEKYEYDVLYENQRGMLVFGIPKFSSRALFQWDPSPWTGPSGRDSPYTVANAQLPDPSWEWVHEEWLVDMAGDVDEAGWQYSASFGGIWPPHFIRSSFAMPRSGADGAAKFNKRLEEKQKKRDEKEATREDDGIEAIKRSTRALGSSWAGVAGPGSFVRRRKWIRLRRRRPLNIKAAHAAGTPTPKVELPGQSMGSGDWAKLIPTPSKDRRRSFALSTDTSPAQPPVRSDEMVDSSSSSSLDLDEEDEVSDEDRAEAGARPPTFYPRRLPGNLHNGAHPLEARLDTGPRRRRRHAKEFTGTVRELKSLLPAIIAKRSTASGGQGPQGSAYASHHAGSAADEKARLWLSEIDARNPFISWRLVKKRLEGDDLAFASATLRAKERHFQQRRSATRKKRAEAATKRRLPSGFLPSGADASDEAPSASGKNDFAPAALSNCGLPIAAEARSLTRDALIEINFRRVLRVMRACKLDRHKHQLWRLWLGVETLTNVVEPPRREDLIDLGLSPAVNGQKDSLAKARSILRAKAQTRWRNTVAAVDPLDVWDVIERRLDSLLMLFEFQGSRASFIRLLLEIHASAHADHRFRQTDWKLDVGEGRSVHPNVPSVLSPAKGGLGLEDGSAGKGQVTPPDGWQQAGLPRLEFFSDLIACARAVLAASDGHGGTSASAHPSTMATTAGAAELASPEMKATSDMSDIGSPNPSVINLDGLSTDRTDSPRPPSRPCSPAVRSVAPASSSSQHLNSARRPSSVVTSGESDRAFLRELLKYTEAVGRKDPLSSSALITHTTGQASGAKSTAAAASVAAGGSVASSMASPLGVVIPSRESSSLAGIMGGSSNLLLGSGGTPSRKDLSDIESAKRHSHAQLLKTKAATTPSKNSPTKRLHTLSPSATISKRLPDVEHLEDGAAGASGGAK